MVSRPQNSRDGTLVSAYQCYCEAAFAVQSQSVEEEVGSEAETFEMGILFAEAGWCFVGVGDQVGAGTLFAVTEEEVVVVVGTLLVGIGVGRIVVVVVSVRNLRARCDGFR
jgi:hypothetical protein